jgi:hypothetical protein
LGPLEPTAKTSAPAQLVSIATTILDEAPEPLPALGENLVEQEALDRTETGDSSESGTTNAAANDGVEAEVPVD